MNPVNNRFTINLILIVNTKPLVLYNSYKNSKYKYNNVNNFFIFVFIKFRKLKVKGLT